ncbi:hypothetical protein ACVWVP_003582 [Pseudomonas sp. TE24901]
MNESIIDTITWEDSEIIAENHYDGGAIIEQILGALIAPPDFCFHERNYSQ